MSERQINSKLVLLGESAVGKSSIVLRFVKSQFSEFQEATIGAAFLTQTVVCGDPQRTVRFEIWDTAGQERYHSLAPMYYRGAQAAIIVYDITNAGSFQRAKSWVNELNEQANSVKVIALAGNKLDLEEQRAVSIDSSPIVVWQSYTVFVKSAPIGVEIAMIRMSEVDVTVPKQISYERETTMDIMSKNKRTTDIGLCHFLKFLQQFWEQVSWSSLE